MRALLPHDLEVIRVRAIPTKPLRIVGDISIRSFPFYLKAIKQLAQERPPDFIHITIPANYAALLGPIVFRRHGIPYGIDYIDPWVTGADQHRPLSKPWFAQQVARVAEPHAVRNASLITGINTAYFERVVDRNPHLRSIAVTAGMPYGGSELDYDALNRRPRQTFLFDAADGLCHVIYAGALLPKATEVLDRFLAAIAKLRARVAPLTKHLRIHFVGTGLCESEPNKGHTVEPFIRKYHLEDCVTEHPSRISYLDVLNHLRHASAILVIGSTEAFYSPSKIYQSVMSRRPVFALLHKNSTAVQALRNSRGGDVFTFTGTELPEPDKLADAFGKFLSVASNRSTNVDWQAFASVSARESARVLANAMEEALNRRALSKL
jgi:hypothetical protein